MDLKAKLLDFLIQLPGVDDATRRKGLVAYSGFAHLAIHLYWQGSNADFFRRFLDQFGAHGQQTLAQFLDQLPNWPGLTAEHREQAARLQRELQALSAEAWQQQFDVGRAPAAEASAPQADMLTMSLVSTVLTPYFKLGAEELRRRGDAGTMRLAERVWQHVQVAFTGDAASADLLELYPQMPEAMQAKFTERLNAKMAANPALARELAELLIRTGTGDEAPLRKLINIAQSAGTVKGEMVGVVFGKAALPPGTSVDVDQKIDTVGEGGTAVGAVIGGEGPVHMGGEQQYGDRVEGDKQEINTDGGAYIGGNVTAGGDFVGRDKTVSIRQGLSGADLERLFAPLIAAARAAPPEKREQALQTVQAIQKEAAKVEKANDSRLATLVDGLVALAPGAAGALVSTFATPVLGGLVGPVTAFVLEKVKGGSSSGR